MFFHRNKIRAFRSVRLATSILGLLVGFQVLGKESSPLGYPVSRISFSHAQSFDDLPDLSELAKASLELDCSESVVSLFDLMRGASPVLPMSHKDFFKLSEVALHFMKSKGYEGVVVFPDPKQINPVSGKDLRKQGDTTLGFLVWVSVLKSVRLDTAGLKEKEEKPAEGLMDAYLESGFHRPAHSLAVLRSFPKDGAASLPDLQGLPRSHRRTGQGGRGSSGGKKTKQAVHSIPCQFRLRNHREMVVLGGASEPIN